MNSEMEEEVDSTKVRVKMEEEEDKETEEGDWMAVTKIEKNEDWVDVKGTETTEEETKEGIHDSTMSTIQKFKVCCSTMTYFHKEGMGIRDIAIRARGYIKHFLRSRNPSRKINQPSSI